MHSICAIALSSLALVSLRGPDAGDDQYQFIFGLQRKGMHEMVVREASVFRRDHANHEKRHLARYRLAGSLFALDRHVDAADEFQGLARLTDFEFEPEVWFRLGQCRLAMQEHARAAQAFEHVDGLNDEHLEESAVFLLAEARFQLGEFEPAQRAYGRVSSGNLEGEHARDAAYGQAWCAYRLGQLDRAASHINDYLGRWSTSAAADELRHLLGETEMAAGRPKRALKAFLSVGAGPLHEASLHGAGFASARLGDHLGAARNFATLIDQYPESRFGPEAVLHLGIHLFEVDQYENALLAFELPQVAPSAELYYWKFRALEALGDTERALEALERAGRIDANGELAEQIQMARGDLLFRLGRAEEASNAYGESESEYALYAAAVANLKNGNPESAVQKARQFLQRFPRSSYAKPVLLTLGEALFAQREYALAETAFREYAALPDGNQSSGTEGQRAQALLRAGWCAYLTDKMSAAAKLFAQVETQDSEPTVAAEALYMKGRALAESNQLDRARVALGALLDRYPGDEHIPEALMMLARLEPGDSGIQFLEDVVDRHGESEVAPAALLELGERHSNAGRFEKARKFFQRLRTEHPGGDQEDSAAYGEAWASYSLEDWEATVGHLRGFEERAAVSPELALAALELRIFAADRANRAELAVSTWQAFVRRCADDERLLACARAVSSVLERVERRADARRFLDRVAKGLTSPEAVVSARVAGVWLALSDADTAGAESELRRALSIDSNRAEVCEAAFFVGEARYGAGEDESASALYDVAAVKGSPVADRALYKQGFAQLRLENYSRAARAFGELVDNHPASDLYGESLFLLGEAHFRSAEYRPAAEACRRLLAELPDHDVASKALYRLGVSECQLERWKAGERALSDLARRFQSFEHGVEAELWRGRALSANGELRGARQALRRVMARDDGVLAARARLEMGRIALAENDVESALSEFLKVALLYSNQEEVAEALLLSGQCLELKGDHKRAREQYLELIREYPHASFVSEARKRLGQ